ncbi:MAG: hypothetical protein IKA03_02570 [Alphaproteobacteria bacterium]|nr:hypothetical protein [Alphaproteobacteria bacterium]
MGLVPFAKAEDNIQTLYASVCELVRPDEAKSSARVRATDKASFKAIENISALSEYRNKYDAHDYNVLVYSLVDNYLEDLAARTIKQNDNEICVEITGYLNTDNVAKAINEITNKQEEQYPDKLDIEEKALTQPSPNIAPPKPTLKINDEIAVEKVLAEKEVTKPLDAIPPALINDKRTKIFIERTMFFNDTSTNAFHKDMSRIVEENNKNMVTMSSNMADYIIKTKVLRAKVDPINKQTNRLQMVVSIELFNMENNSSITEHQNRFILFESNENEQSVAASLLRKLLRKAIKQIMPKIKSSFPESKSVITPSAAVGIEN